MNGLNFNDDAEPETVLFECADCDEEYHLPEDAKRCPICRSENICPVE